MNICLVFLFVTKIGKLSDGPIMATTPPLIPLPSPCSPISQHFTFVLTDLESKYRFGHCVYPPGGGRCYCFFSHLPWHEFFYQLLNKLEDIGFYQVSIHVHIRMYVLACVCPGSAKDQGIYVYCGNTLMLQAQVTDVYMETAYSEYSLIRVIRF